MSTKMQMTAAMALFLAIPALLNAQYPPAQGPPPATGNNIQVRDVDFWVTNPTKAKIEEKIVELNAAMAARTDARATLTLQSFQRNGAFLTQTEHLDQPNDRYVKVTYKAIIKVTNIQWNDGMINGQIDWDTYPFDRKIYVNLDIKIFCDGWETGDGIIKVFGDSGPPYLDSDPGFFESVLDFFLGGWLVDTVNAKLSAALQPIPPSSTTIAYWQCNSLDDGPDVFRFAKTPALTFPTPITIQPIRVKRLAANNLYDVVESPGLEFSADFGFNYYSLPPMTEGQEVALIGEPIAVPKPKSGNSLVIIVSTNNIFKDSAFRTFGSPNFGHGTRTIRVNKTFWEPPNPPFNKKPTKRTVPAYEITFRIVNPSAIENVPAAPQPRTPGTVPSPGEIAP